MRPTMIALAAAALALPAFVWAAGTAYTTPTLRVTVSGTTTVIGASGSATDDSTARVAIYAPAGTALAAPAPGSTVGTVEAEASVLGLGGALVPLRGSIVVPPAGTPPPSSQPVCTQGATPSATWLLAWDAVLGQQLPATPAYVLATAGSETALGALKLVVCLPPPDIPEAQGGAPLGAKFTRVTATVRAALTAPASGTWIALWTPYQPATGQPNAAGTVASPSVTSPGAIALGAKRAGARVTVTGTVTQAGQPVGGAAVKLTRGKTAAKLGSFKTVRANAQGKFSVVAPAAAGTFFRATTAAVARTSPAVCASLAGKLPVPCVNGTISGFAATSKVVRAR